MGVVLERGLVGSDRAVSGLMSVYGTDEHDLRAPSLQWKRQLLGVP